MRNVLALLLSAQFLHSAYADESCSSVRCYYYNPESPYVDPDDSQIFKSVLSREKLCGAFSGSFFITAKHTHNDAHTQCAKEIPRGHKVLKMRALDAKKNEHPISFNEHKRKQEAIKRIVVLGDSLSEEGKAVKFLKKLRHPVTGAALHGLAKLAGCPIPNRFLQLGLKPYWNGMFSNGPLWPHYLSAFLDNIAIDNYSFGGATTGARKCRLHHLQKMIQKHLKKNSRSSHLESNLYVIWVGANNYFFADGPKASSDNASERAKAVAKAMDEIETAVELLLSKGARYLLIPTIPNPKVSPKWEFEETRSFENMKEEWARSAELHNKELKKRVAQLSTKWELNISIFDVDQALQENSHMLGDDPSIMWRDHIESTEHNVAQQSGFFDAVHPTTKLHCEFAQHLIKHLHASKLLHPDSKWVSALPSCTKAVENFLAPDL